MRMPSTYRSWLALGVAPIAIISGCMPNRLAAPSGVAAADPAGFAAEIQAASLPDHPQRATFNWTLDEQGSRVRGEGVVRTEAGERLRLDLFGPRGETYLIAALVGDEYRLPPAAADVGTLPSPALLWAALGVVQPPAGATLTNATTEGATAELRYQVGGEQQFVFTLSRADDSPYRLERVQRAGRQGVIETIALDRGEDGSITRARYRDWGAYRDLTLDVESIRPSDPFPAEIWSPNATRL